MSQRCQLWTLLFRLSKVATQPKLAVISVTRYGSGADKPPTTPSALRRRMA